MLTVFLVFLLGWLLASTIGTWAYFAGRSNDESNFPLPKFFSPKR